MEVATGGAAPPSAVIAAMEAMGFRVTHLYGLTESYGPATICAWQPEWDALPAARARRSRGAAGRGVPDARRAHGRGSGDARAGAHGTAPRMGEVMLRGNTRDEGVPPELCGHRGGVPRRLVPHRGPRGLAPGRLHRDQGPVEGHHHLRRRECLVARGRGGPLPAPRRHGGRRRGEAGPEVGRDALRVRHAQAGGGADHRRETSSRGAGEHLAHFKVPRAVVFGPLPKTSTGKIQKYVLREQAKAVE